MTSTVRHPQLVVLAICVLALMSTVGVSMPYPILAAIFVSGPVDGFTHFAGQDPKFLMGLALAANPLGILLGNMFVAPLSDRYGRRAVLSVTLLATLVSYGLAALALSERAYVLFVLARFVTGVTEGNVAVARALLADLHEQVDRTRAFAWLNACLYSGWLMGPVLGGLTLAWGESVPFVLAGLAMLPCWAVLMLGVPKMKRPSVTVPFGQAMREQQALGLLRKDPMLRRLFVLQLAYTVGLNALYEFSPLWLLEHLGLDSRGIAWVTAGQCAVMTLVSMSSGRWGQAPAQPLRRSAQFALLGAVGLLALAAVPGQVGVAVILLMGFPVALYNAVFPAWMSERFAAHGQGRVMGLLATIFCMGNVLIALAGGVLSLMSTRWIMLLGGTTCAVAALLLLKLNQAEIKQ